MQELGQADISILRKAELRERLAVIRKAFDKEVKEREAKANKAVSVYLCVQISGRYRVVSFRP